VKDKPFDDPTSKPEDRKKIIGLQDIKHYEIKGIPKDLTEFASMVSGEMNYPESVG
jgi:hypothetical protein